MKYPIEYNAITAKIEFYSEVVEMHEKATEYLLAFEWCKMAKSSLIYLNLGLTLCIFLFEIENSSSNVDNYLWVIVGDIPSMYLDVHGPKTTIEVLEDYADLANDWVGHIKEGKSIDDCYPFRVEPTVEFAMMLEKRCSFIKNTIIQNTEDIKLKIK